MNGAQALIRTLAGCGVEVCFSNPGTSEMHFVAALDAVPEMHGVLCLFEGVATGAADGYGRMSGRNGMSGAQALIRTLAGCGVEVCFSNPGTSEMHFVAALDAV